MPSRKSYDNTNPALSDEEFEELTDLAEEEEAQMDRDLATDELYDTQHGDGHTYNPTTAWEQGMVYTPPHDPPIMPGETRQDAEVNAGFSESMEATGVDEEILPSDVDNNDDELRNDIYEALQRNSETMHLTDITVHVRNGIVTLLGTITDGNDEALIDEVLSDLEGIEEIRYRLEVED